MNEVPELTLNLPSGARSTVKVQPSHIRRVSEASERRALVYVLIAATISWLLGWPRVAPLPLAPLGIALFVVAWILPVWAIVLFRRQGYRGQPNLIQQSQARDNRSLQIYPQPNGRPGDRDARIGG